MNDGAPINPAPQPRGNQQESGKIPSGSSVKGFMLEVIMQHLNLDQQPSTTDDFFEIGGTSLTAAIVISEFRDNPRTESLAVRDIYEQRTVQALVSLCTRDENEAEDVADLPSFKKSKLFQSPCLITFIQSIILLFHLMVSSAISYVILLYPLQLFGLTGKLYLIIMPVYAVLAFWLKAPVFILWAVIVKWTLIGRYNPGRYPIWGSFYLRHWICQRYVALIPWDSFSGTIFQVWTLRFLGAKIGERVHIHRGVDFKSGGWDLLTIGNDVLIGRDAGLHMLEYENHEMVIGKITIGDGVTMATRSGLCNDTSVRKGSYISALSVVTSGTHVPSGVYWEGVPGKVTGIAPGVPEINKKEHVWPPIGFAIVLMSQEFILDLLTGPIFLIFVWHNLIKKSSILYFNNTIAYIVPLIAGWTFVSLVLMALYCRCNQA